MKEHVKSYTSLQYILWLISGSEISILEKCPTDYNRHAGIGFTILMTSLFGAFAGGYAGYYFTHNIGGALFFGFLWGLLIFSIDRTMVVSLKKRPETSWKSHFWQILFRAILAALIAFIISIPLELLIFKDNIDAGQPFYQQSQKLKLLSGQDSLYDPVGDAKEKLAEEKKIEKADSLLSTDPTDEDFKNLIYSFNLNTNKLNTLKRNLSEAQVQSKKHYDESFYEINGEFLPDKESDAYKKYIASKRNEREFRNQLSILYKEKNSLEKTIQELRNKWKLNLQTDKDIAKVQAKKIAEEIAVEKDKMNVENNKLDSTLKVIEQSFVVRFDVLTFLSNKRTSTGEREFASIFFLLWLVRILFFIIEILPTIVKVATPFGAYDMAVYEEEENFKNIKLPAAKRILEEKVKDEHEMEKIEKDRQLSNRLKREGEIHDLILQEISTTQEKIAKNIIDQWKSKHLKEGNGNV